MSSSSKQMTLKSTLIDTRDLIRLVKERKILWDRFDVDYRDRYLKEAAWLQIYKAIEPDYDLFSEDMKTVIGAQITKKWSNVRDSYVKSKRHGKNKPYIYSKLLNFLEPVYFDEKEKIVEKEKSKQWLNEVFSADEESVDKRQKLDLDRSEKEDNLMTIVANLLSKEEDEDRAFFNSIMPSVKKLTEESRMEFRIQLMNLLQTLQMRDKAVTFKVEFDDNDDSGSGSDVT